MTQYTKGPWKHYPPSTHQGKKSLRLSGHVISGNGEVIAQCNNAVGKSEGNATLIACAPRILAALQGLWEAQSRLNGNLPTWFNEAAEQARQAIAEATGKT